MSEFRDSIAVHAAHDSAVPGSTLAERSIDAIQWSVAICPDASLGVEANIFIWRGGRCAANFAANLRRGLALPPHLRHQELRHMKKARAWLDSHGVTYGFMTTRPKHAKENSKQWADELGWETLLNSAPAPRSANCPTATGRLNERKALALMLRNPR